MRRKCVGACAPCVLRVVVMSCVCTRLQNQKQPVCFCLLVVKRGGSGWARAGGSASDLATNAALAVSVLQLSAGQRRESSPA